MLNIVLLMLAAAGGSTDDKTFHGCPTGWEVGTDGWEVGSTDGWEVGSVCKDEDGKLWMFDGKSWVPVTE